jgi:hypothetical protein
MMNHNLQSNRVFKCIRWCAVAMLAIAMTGCGRNEIKVYSVPKELPADQHARHQPMAAGHADMAAPRQKPLTWKTPEGWTEVPPSEMRVASFKIAGKDGKQADLSVVPLSGGGGGDFTNVNRWRGQVGLEAVSADALKGLAQSVDLASQPADLYDMAGKNPGSGDPTRVLGAIQHRDSVAWFFKMTGDDDLVAEQKPAFIEFLKSVQFVGQQTAVLPPSHPPIDGATLPAGHPEVSSAPPVTAAAPATEGRPAWEAPSDWKEIPGGQFLVAKFTIPGEGAPTAVNVSMSAGTGGGLAANVNRWRQQLGLAELSDSEVEQLGISVEIPGGKATFVEMSGTDVRSGQPARLVGAMVPRTGETWFYKLMGDSKLVTAQKEAFTKFVQSVKY